MTAHEKLLPIRAAGSSVNFPRLLLEREHAGYSRDAMKAVYPSNCWPAEWHDDDEEQVQDQEETDDDRHT